MPNRELLAGLLTLAAASAADPVARVILQTALEEALEMLRRPTRAGLDLAAELDDVAGAMVVLGDRAEWLAEKMRTLMAASPQPEDEPAPVGW